MAMTAAERKQAQRSRPGGYAKSRQSSWKQQGINDTTYVEYLTKLENQHSLCGICGCHITSQSALDHNHATGEARGLLCSACNLLLGKLENGGRMFLQNAAAYLVQWQS